jgi:[glutamine synthetase] adenylyltransferase / [glutamine synthetase]-adenylyl-L-tyrosine phosphorylase
MRLRPSGNKGPLAASLSSFIAYQRDSAWTWEKQALTRARSVAGDASLMHEVQDEITRDLCSSRDGAKTQQDVLDMRRLMLREQKNFGPWDVKRVPGGLVDVEFIAQYLQLAHAARHPNICQTNTDQALAALMKVGVLDLNTGATLRAAWHSYAKVLHVLRLCLDVAFDPATAPFGLVSTLNRAVALPDLAAVTAMLAETQVAVAKIFNEIIGEI